MAQRRARPRIDELVKGTRVHSIAVGTAAEFDGVVEGPLEGVHGVVLVKDANGKLWQRYTRELSFR